MDELISNVENNWIAILALFVSALSFYWTKRKNDLEQKSALKIRLRSLSIDLFRIKGDFENLLHDLTIKIPKDTIKEHDQSLKMVKGFVKITNEMAGLVHDMLLEGFSRKNSPKRITEFLEEKEIYIASMQNDFNKIRRDSYWMVGELSKIDLQTGKSTKT
ncbi:hypothetical protein [Ekhidna sp.]